MELKKFWLGVVFVSACTIPARGQQADSLLLNDPYIAELDSLIASGDTGFLSLIDSLINVPVPAVKSQLIMRLGYNSNVVAASRTLGFNQFGVAPGVSFYHKSGLYADYTGYWSKEYDPQYYLTVLSGGYLASPATWWSVMAEYNRYLYAGLGEDDYIAYKSSAGISNFFDTKWVTFRLDYQFFFGDKVAHRINPSLMLNFEKTKLGPIDRLAFYPTASVLYGSEQITEWIPYARTYIGIIYRVRRNLPLYYEQETTRFGVLNYSFSAPVSVSINNWTLLLSYSYNIPRALPGEPVSLESSGYISASISKRIEF
ncbi:MAG: hypothetical protein KIT62_09480 [Cyclobacteriaceae bacterium]|nr:hypothetical protein [Cyclobacteriaceae bacterium]